MLNSAGILLSMSQYEVPHSTVAILGSGFSGLAMAVELSRAGIDDFVILERAATLGGTWRDNHYPGCVCDVPSHLYSFSFAPKSDWSCVFAPQVEIRAYLEKCADDFDVRRHIRFETNLAEARWDEIDMRWHLRTGDGRERTANAVVLGIGALSNPAIPALPGIDRFRGAQFHSAEWDHDYDLAGKRVAVIGTGASAIQFVPQIQPEVEQLYVVQRTPPWILPKPDRPYTDREKRAFGSVPGLRWLYRQSIYARLEGRVIGLRHPALLGVVEREGKRHIARHIDDPELRARVTPTYKPGCKRVLLSNDYYPALAAPNFEVIDEGVSEVGKRSITFADGRTVEVDAIIYGTGFKVHDYLGGIRIFGTGGEDVGERWTETGAQAYLGTTVAGCPNLFFLMGPNTGLGHNSMIAMIEGQAHYARQAIEMIHSGRADAIEPRRQRQDDYNQWINQRNSTTVWASGCRSWYLDDQGRNTTLWPSFVTSFRARTVRLRPGDYELRKRPVGTLAGKVVLITGAARGIGAETARRVAARGARVALLGLEPERLAEVARELGPQHAWFECDVTDQAALERAVDGAVRQFGGIDVVVANAGVANNGTVAVNPADALAWTIDVNLTGVIRTVSVTLPHVTERRGYYLIVSSASALRPLPGLSAYAASKVGVEYFASSLRLELAHKGVAVGVGVPCWIDTDLVRDQQQELDSFNELLRRLPGPFGTVTSVEECADAFARAIEGRERATYVPKSLRWFAPIRSLLSTGPVDWLMARQMRSFIPRLEADVRALGRAFGRQSVGARRDQAA